MTKPNLPAQLIETSFLPDKDDIEQILGALKYNVETAHTTAALDDIRELRAQVTRLLEAAHFVSKKEASEAEPKPGQIRVSYAPSSYSGNYIYNLHIVPLSYPDSKMVLICEGTRWENLSDNLEALVERTGFPVVFFTSERVTSEKLTLIDREAALAVTPEGKEVLDLEAEVASEERFGRTEDPIIDMENTSNENPNTYDEDSPF